MSSAVDAEIRFAAPRPDGWEFGPEPAIRPAAPAAATGRPRTIPYFEDSFISAGQTYAYRMVGSNPRQSGRRTVVPVVIVPLRFVFADGQKLDPGRTTAELRRSPIFRRATFGGDTTQYGDAVQRAEFWAYTQGTGYHALLARPSVTHTVVVRVPASDGSIRQSSHGGTVGLVDEQFFSLHVVPRIVNGKRLPPTKLLVFWSYNVDLQSPGSSGVILGEHSLGRDRAGTTIWTWVWASWHTPDTVPEADADIAPLSHEIAEWYNNPFAANVVPSWSAPPYSCNDLLEVGDPLVGMTFVKDGYHLQDEAFLAWFAREVPSTALGGMYSLIGTLTAVPPVCSSACSRR